MTRFSDLGLDALILQNLEALGYDNATPVQSQAIPVILKGRDLMASAQTGTGKTAAFTLPLLQRLLNAPAQKKRTLKMLILVPTRELAEQVQQAVIAYSANLPFSAYAVYGGVALSPQITALKQGTDIVVATPGRLLDLYRQNAVDFSELQYLVLDEADRMLDLGFADELDELFCALPRRRQTLLFSATFSDRIKTLAADLLRDPAQIAVAVSNSAADTLDQWLIPLDKKRRPEVLQQLVEEHAGQQILIFVRMRKTVDELETLFTRIGYRTGSIHGDKSQPARMKAMQAFRDGDVQILIATDVAARGLDVEALPLVINYELPFNAEDYVHRIGRSGRKGRTGKAVSLVTAEDVQQLNAIEILIGQIIKRRVLKGFEPQQKVPKTPLDLAALSLTKDKAPPRGKSGGGGGLRFFDHDSGGAKPASRKRRR